MRSLSLLLLAVVPLPGAAEPWARHVIDDSSRGADGVRLADVNGDGLPDIVTGWEEGGVVRLYLNPGLSRVKQRWPAVTVGKVASPEDAVLADLDGDGAPDVVSCCEGKTRTVFIHWAPSAKPRLLDDAAWLIRPIPCTAGRTQWMFAAPVELDGRPGLELIVGSKGPQAMVGWLRCHGDRRDPNAWTLWPLCPAGWIMSLAPLDMDGDGDMDVLVSDRKGKRSGVYWLAHPGLARVNEPWAEHRIGAAGEEVMFLDVGDRDANGRRDVVVAVKPRNIFWFAAPDHPTDAWKCRIIPFPDRFGTAKAVRIGRINDDGRPDLVVSCEQAAGTRSGVFWLEGGGATETAWKPHDIAGPSGEKYDLVELLDLDGDGDLDVLTCEERDNLGVIWYENPRVNHLGSFQR